jgi:hypothetical protein
MDPVPKFQKAMQVLAHPGFQGSVGLAMLLIAVMRILLGCRDSRGGRALVAPWRIDEAHFGPGSD